ncbi:hypothetical protein SAMN04488109_1148 [Chryseolinea serpens]|uniref:DUF4468 domain-containing protein n=1 Tax=Chryseolinea serpens TaxID=947013 RepID=A0A1M5LD73_9BACT|nr:hypothetical protein [Chryseolinea serpens]SHG62977.1 hypothetical protein SAMN04488109_1148 [Chryseolinea serpens]
MKINYKTVLLVVISNFFALNALAQGAWNIKYLPIDSVKESLVGKAVRVDFKAKPSDRIEGKVSVRRMLIRRDTVSLSIDGVSRRFIENWAIYVDSGVLGDQTLTSIDKSKKIIIKEMFMQAIGSSSITLQVFVYASGETNKEVKEITIDKKVIQGILSTL